ncbi:hypothetical protein ACQEVS_12935 [Streptomyces sp. CA-181903]|uniref:hypothetical protein n=1 Tax=Streptomyces sp. CA-181903 TaxID=3240055 RepID=UPI003D923930
MDNTARADLHMTWLPPAFFHPLPLDSADAEEAADRLYSLAERLLPSGTDEDRVRMCVAYGFLLQDFIEAGAEYAAFCALDMGDGRRSTASLAMYRIPLEGYADLDLLDQMASALRDAYPRDDVRFSELSCGRVVVRIGDEPFVVPSEFSGAGTSIEMLKGIIQVYIPLPDRSEIAVLELATPAMDDWDFYSELFASIVQTVSWATEEEILFLTTPSQIFHPSDSVSVAAAQEVYAHSSNILDALALHGSVSPESRLTKVVCPDCRVASRTVPCSLLHEWFAHALASSADYTDVVRRAEASLLARTWKPITPLATGDRSFSAVHTAGYRLGLTPCPSNLRLLVKVLGPCRRSIEASAGHGLPPDEV